MDYRAFFLLVEAYGESSLFNRVDCLTQREIQDLFSVVDEHEKEMVFHIEYEDELQSSDALKRRLEWNRFCQRYGIQSERYPPDPFELTDWQYGLYLFSQECINELIKLRHSHVSPERIEKANKVFHEAYWQIVFSTQLLAWHVDQIQKDPKWTGPLSETHTSSFLKSIVDFSLKKMNEAARFLRQQDNPNATAPILSTVYNIHRSFEVVADWIRISKCPEDNLDYRHAILMGFEPAIRNLRHFLSRITSKMETTDNSQNIKPKWDRGSGKLTLRGKMIRRIHARATNVIPLLDQFEECGWPDRIDDTFSDDEHGKGARREAIRTLNRGLSEIIFKADGNGTGTVWELCGSPLN